MRSQTETLPEELQAALEDAPGRGAAMQEVWAKLGTLRDLPVTPDVGEAWGMLNSGLESAPVPSPLMASDRPARNRSHRSRATWLVAASALVLIVACSTWWLQPVVVATAPGVQTRAVLPDGSLAELNSASNLQYRREFGAVPVLRQPTRLVRLRGEAFFSVTHNAARPFIVETSDARIEVLGTRFNVRARDTQNGTRTVVTLQEGRVRVAAVSDSSRPTVLDSAGATVDLEESARPGMRAELRSLDHVLAWRTRGFAAVDEPVSEILKEVQRRYAIHLEVSDALADDPPMTVFYLRGTSPEEIIHDLCLARGWKYRETSRGYALFAANGPEADATRGRPSSSPRSRQRP